MMMYAIAIHTTKYTVLHRVLRSMPNDAIIAAPTTPIRNVNAIICAHMGSDLNFSMQLFILFFTKPFD